jgi:hypothetical protein
MSKSSQSQTLSITTSSGSETLTLDASHVDYGVFSMSSTGFVTGSGGGEINFTIYPVDSVTGQPLTATYVGAGGFSNNSAETTTPVSSNAPGYLPTSVVQLAWTTSGNITFGSGIPVTVVLQGFSFSATISVS